MSAPDGIFGGVFYTSENLSYRDRGGIDALHGCVRVRVCVCVCAYVCVCVCVCVCAVCSTFQMYYHEESTHPCMRDRCVYI